ncbi:MAG TPA: 23S rRNA (pseudouridine(1915)-N(3))-methyltransferase RlmH [Steroidobacteraceae bacterium]|nr:23S rRNA (pseudouridine(1915)-N(3))-methyltransferase RlmH [Steroidobacteraceae bacterium]
MRIRVVAIGSRMPGWVDAACTEYLKRLAPHVRASLLQIPSPSRSAKAHGPRVVAAEGERLLAALDEREFVVVLDERGRELTTRELGAWLETRRADGRDVAFVIGGPDGLSLKIQARANLTLALSRLTLPHGLARVLLLEQLYRAHSLLANHPYHRD